MWNNSAQDIGHEVIEDNEYQDARQMKWISWSSRNFFYCMGMFSRPRHREREARQSLSCWVEETELKIQGNQDNESLQSTRKKEAAQRHNSRWLKRVPLEHLVKHPSVHASERTMQDSGKNHMKELEEIDPRLHPGLRKVTIPNSPSGKPHNSGRIRELWRILHH